MSKIKTTVVSEEEFVAEGFRPPATFYIRPACYDYLFIHCREKSKAVEYVKEEWGGKYTVRAAKNQKTKSRLESGGFSCYGTETRSKR